MDSSSENMLAWLASFSGVDGGNPDADVWVCGIEHGGACELLVEPLIPELSPGEWSERFKKAHPNYTTWQYHQKVAKLMVAIRAPGKLASDIPGWREYLKDELYSAGGDCFKLNLFPLSSRNVKSVEWSKAYGMHSALRDKASYYDLCRNEGRFSFFQKARIKYGPKFIIGTGITFSSDFARAFGFLQPSTPFEITDGTVRRRCHRYTDAHSTLIVSPFFGGRYGVNSNGLLIDLARHVALKKGG